MIESDYHDSLIFEHGMSAVSPRQLFGGLNSQLPTWYTGRHMSAKEAAKILGLDHSTIREQARAGRMNGKQTNGVWRFSIRDLSDYIAGGHWHGTRLVRPWTKDDIEELLATGACRGRTEAAIKTMKNRLKKHCNAPLGRS